MNKLEKYQNEFYSMVKDHDFFVNEEVLNIHSEKKFVELEDSTLWVSPNDMINFHIDNYTIWMEPYCGCYEGLGDSSYHIGFLVNGKIVIDKELTREAAKGIYVYSLNRLSEIEESMSAGEEPSEEDVAFLLTVCNMCELLSDKVKELILAL